MTTGQLTATQPYRYRRREMTEPDWTRLPGWRKVDTAEWESARWQRAHSIRNPAQLRGVMGDLLLDTFYADLERDQRLFATMPLMLTPHMLNQMVAGGAGSRDGWTAAFYDDPVRRYMLPVASDRDPVWPSHPMAHRDPLHEAKMWPVEGLTHRYPVKVLAELVTTCPQYCGHCTRMDLVGPSTAQVEKRHLKVRRPDRFDAMLTYLREHPSVRDVVVSGGDVANLPWPRLEAFVIALLSIESIRDIRLASKAVMGLPQHWLTSEVRTGMARLAGRARARGVRLAVHTHVNSVNSVTPLLARATRALMEAGVHEVRNQGVLLRAVNDDVPALLDLCFALLDDANVMPYYFYLCDMVPHSEHWRLPVHEAERLQNEIMGYLPGFGTPRLVCDVPGIGKRWTGQYAEYDRRRGISYWTKNFDTPLEIERGESYDPISSLPPDGQAWWRERRERCEGTE